MKTKAIISFITVVFLLSVTVTFAEVPQEDLTKIYEAAPNKPPAKPKKPRKVLVYSRAVNYKHTSIPYGAHAFRILGEKTGAYSPVLSEDPAMFDHQNLYEFDAVIFNNNCHGVLPDPVRRQNLLDFVKSGRGFVGIHSASYAPDWPEFLEMLGGQSVSHPWNAGSQVTLHIREPEHPLVKMFGSEPLEYIDEIFQYDFHSHQKLRVLVTLDTVRTNMNLPGVKTDKDYDFALVWVRNYGKGRVFYTEFGHQEDVYWRPVILNHYLAGIQFALGDLEADATPTIELDKRMTDDR